MKSGDLVKMTYYRQSDAGEKVIEDYGLFLGLKSSGGYEYAEVIWFNRRSPNGDAVSTVQKDLIEVVNESR